MKLGIDIGNYNVNTSENIMFKACISNHKEFGSCCDKLVYEGKAHYIGEGKLEIDYRKFDKSNYLPLLLAAICKSCTHEEVEIGVGLPLTQYKENRNELTNMLNSKEFKVEFNGVSRRVKIVKATVFPEGIASYVSSNEKLKGFVQGRDVVVVDIGGGTTDISLIRGRKALKSTSINKGTIDIYNVIKIALEEKYFDINISIDNIQMYIDRGFWYKGEKQDISFAIKRSNDIFKEIYNELKLNYPINTEAVVLAGGGSDLLLKVFKSKINSIAVDGDLYANAKGFKILMK